MQNVCAVKTKMKLTTSIPSCIGLDFHDFVKMMSNILVLTFCSLKQPGHWQTLHQARLYRPGWW